MASTETTHDDLAKRLEELQETDHFDPPEAFVAEAMDTDDSLWKEAAKDPVHLVGGPGQGSFLVLRVGHGARRLRPAVLHVVRRRDDQRVLQLPRPPHRERARRAGRDPLARRGGRGARHHLRVAARAGAALRQRPEGQRRRVRRRRRHLHADDPRGHRRDARVRTHRRAAQRRLRRVLARVGPRADGDIGGQGARHRRRRAAQGQDRADQARGRRRHGRRRLDREDLRGRVDRRRLRDAGGPRRLVARGDGGREPRVRGRAARCRAPAVHPVLVRLDEQAEGHPAHDRRLPDRRRLDDEARLRPQARDGRVLVRGRRRLDHRALLHRLRPAAQRPDPGHVRGAAGLPVQGPPLEARRTTSASRSTTSRRPPSGRS